MTAVLDSLVEAPTPPTAIVDAGFARTAQALDAAAAKHNETIAADERVGEALAKARDEHAEAVSAHADSARRLALGEPGVSAAKTRLAVQHAEGDVEGFTEAKKITEADRAAAYVEFLKATVAHGVHDEARLRLVIVEKTRNLAKGGRLVQSLIIDVTKAVSDLSEAVRDNRAELYKLNPTLAGNASRHVCDETLHRPDRLAGGALGGHLIDQVVAYRPSGIDLDAIAAREEAQAARDVR